MPLSRYDRLVTSRASKQKGSAAEVKASFVKEYGEKRGTELFYRWVNKRRKQRGMEKSIPAPGSRLSAQLRKQGR